MAIEELQTIESRIVTLLQQDRYRWQELAQLALHVRKEKLYLDKGLHSFTAWIKGVAKSAGRQPSLFWRYLKAAVYYLRQIESEDIDKIGDIQAAPEALDRLEKIERQAPRPVFEAMRDKVLAGEATVLECRRVEQQYRPANAPSNRGRPLKGEEGSYAHLGQWRVPEDQEEAQAQAEELGRDRITAALKSSLQTYALLWSRDCAVRPYTARNYGVYGELVPYFDGQPRKIDVLAVTQWAALQPKELLGVNTKSCLAEYEEDGHWRSYISLCHYFCFAVPKRDVALQDAIAEGTPSHIGILTVDLDASPDTNTFEPAYPVSILRLPNKTKGNASGNTYEALFDTLLGWNSELSTQE